VWVARRGPRVILSEAERGTRSAQSKDLWLLLHLPFAQSQSNADPLLSFAPSTQHKPGRPIFADSRIARIG
jgi:hypothetical protein